VKGQGPTTDTGESTLRAPLKRPAGRRRSRGREAPPEASPAGPLEPPDDPFPPAVPRPDRPIRLAQEAREPPALVDLRGLPVGEGDGHVPLVHAGDRSADGVDGSEAPAASRREARHLQQLRRGHRVARHGQGRLRPVRPLVVHPREGEAGRPPADRDGDRRRRQAIPGRRVRPQGQPDPEALRPQGEEVRVRRPELDDRPLPRPGGAREGRDHERRPRRVQVPRPARHRRQGGRGRRLRRRIGDAEHRREAEREGPVPDPLDVRERHETLGRAEGPRPIDGRSHRAGPVLDQGPGAPEGAQDHRLRPDVREGIRLRARGNEARGEVRGPSQWPVTPAGSGSGCTGSPSG